MSDFLKLGFSSEKCKKIRSMFYRNSILQEKGCIISIEVYNRVTWTTLLLATFQFIKKDTQNPKNIYPYPQKSLSPPFILKKIIALKNHTYKPQTFPITSFHTKKKSRQKSIPTIWKYLYNPFHTTNFFKVTIIIKSIHTNLKHHYNPFSY